MTVSILGFKTLGDCIACLGMLPHTRTNESRNNIDDPSTASYRADTVLVLFIHNKHTKEDVTEMQNSCFGKRITYRVGEIVTVKDFNTNLEETFATGIHYFKNYQTAFLYDLDTSTYTGKWMEYTYSGKQVAESNFVNGVKNGKGWLIYPNDESTDVREWVDGVMHGECRSYRKDGQLWQTLQYEKGAMSGVLQVWNRSGRLFHVALYSNNSPVWSSEYYFEKDRQ